MKFIDALHYAAAIRSGCTFGAYEEEKNTCKILLYSLSKSERHWNRTSDLYHVYPNTSI